MNDEQFAFRITNKGRATVAIMAEAERDSEIPLHYRAADALADAGLLAPDLPEPDNNTFIDCEDYTVWAAPGFYKVRLEIADGRLTPDEAREIAHSMLAAADHAEGKKQ